MSDFLSVHPPAFDGGSNDTDAAYDWIIDLESIFDFLKFEDEQRVRSAIFMIRGYARFWWKSVEPPQDDNGKKLLSWQEFKDKFLDHYFPVSVRHRKESEFLNLKQGNMTVEEYERQFLKLSRFTQLTVSDMDMAYRFVMGLRPEIRGTIDIQNYSSAYRFRSQPGQDHGSSGIKREHGQISSGIKREHGQISSGIKREHGQISSGQISSEIKSEHNQISSEIKRSIVRYLLK